MSHWRNYLFLIFSIIVLNSCSSEPEKYVPKTHIIEIAQMKFQPEELTVHKGDTVVWVNKDIVAHDVTEVPNASWSSSNLASGKSWKLEVQESADYYCSIHQVMKGKLVVE